MNDWDSSKLSSTNRMHREPDVQQPNTRAEWVEMLTPLICCALRTGAGRPALVQWVQRALPYFPAADAEELAPRMARVLSVEMMRRKNPDTFVVRSAAAETAVSA